MVQIATGASRGGAGGILNMWVGDSDSGKAGNVGITGGLNLDWNGEGDGGEVNIVSGTAASSGRRSGSVLVASGTTVEGVTGSVSVRSGDSIDGDSGAVKIQVGNGNCGRGGSVTILSGMKSNRYQTPGNVLIVSG